MAHRASSSSPSPSPPASPPGMPRNRVHQRDGDRFFTARPGGPTPRQVALTLASLQQMAAENARLEALLHRKQAAAARGADARLATRFPARRPRNLPKLSYRLAFTLQVWPAPAAGLFDLGCRSCSPL